MTDPTSEAAAVDALMQASRALVGITARSLAGTDADVTLPQFRALVVLSAGGPRRVADVAAELRVNPSTGTRMCDRLVRKGLIRREPDRADRRVVRLRPTPAGRDLVDRVLSQRRAELTRLVGVTARLWRPEVTAALRAFAEAAGEVPEQRWWLGWAARDDDGGDDGGGDDDPAAASTGRSSTGDRSVASE